ncbi:hypothetical protein H5410_022985 [Solanum commersonii]|uniref:Putative plant transposon protein domain-containing protein n=1 Tax=Solanum commersonii TaxID=4109 RepID=A0A9J5ZIJ3_SOLCO|nr:hypothetical protein H5410_022985 [Solanum commersonii]
MAQLITEERRLLTGSLHTVPDIHRLFNLHKCDWMARDPGTYSEDIVREFYASYAATLRGSISKRSNPMDQDPLTSIVVRGCLVDISHATISRFLYCLTTGHSLSLNTTEFEYRCDIVQNGAFQRNAEQREAIILWLAKYIAADGEHAEWIAVPRLGILKATLNFVAKFFWLLVRNRVSPTKADNQLIWERVIMVPTLVAGVEIDFACMLLVEIHERAFKTSTTYPFPWTLDISLIRDEANVVAPRREPQIEVPFLGSDLADTAASMALSSSRSTPQLGATVVPLARVQKLEAQMATLLHYIHHWMQKSIAESEVRMERRMEGMMDWMVQEAELASLQNDDDAILAAPTFEPQAHLLHWLMIRCWMLYSVGPQRRGLSLHMPKIIMPPRRAVRGFPARHNVDEQKLPNAPEVQPQGQVTNAEFREAIRMLS